MATPSSSSDDFLNLDLSRFKPAKGMSQKVTTPVTPSQKDIKLWKRFTKDRLTIEEIASREKVTQARVQKALDRVELYEYAYSVQAAQIRGRDVYLDLMETARSAVNDARAARRYDDKGVDIGPDLALLNKTMAVVGKLTALFEPKGGGVVVNANNQTNNTLNMGADGRQKSMEQRVRELREKKGLLLEAPVIAAEEVLDGDPDPDEDDDEEEDDDGDDEFDDGTGEA